MSEKIDLFKQLGSEYVSPKEPVLINTSPGLYLAIDGRGEPGGEDFQTRIGALYAVAFTIKMTRKSEAKGDYVIGKLECLWGDSEIAHAMFLEPPSEWAWCLMIRTPEVVDSRDLERAQKVLIQKGKGPHIEDVSLRQLSEGECIQMLHVGPYERECESIQRMESFAAALGRKPHGPFHEIHVSDPRRVPPERLKTILRIPLKP